MLSFGLSLNILATMSTSLALLSLTWRSSSAQITSEKALSPWPGTRPVKWTLYTGTTMTWNAASHFCHDKGGHLPVLNTFLAIIGFLQLPLKEKDSTTGVWIGLHRVKADEDFFAWEKNCNPALNDSKFWAEGHPKQDRSCIRIPKDKFGTEDTVAWFSTRCDMNKTVICEFAGESSFQILHNHNFSVDPIATARNVNSSEQCGSLCQELRVARAECVAALFEPEDMCKLFEPSREAEPVQVPGITNYSSILMTRNVFPYIIHNLTEEESSNYTSAELPTAPAGHPDGCNATEPCFYDVIPDGVTMACYDPVSTMCGNSCIRGRSFKMTDSVTDFNNCDATSNVCGDQKVAIAESEKELEVFIQCLCQDKDLPGFVVRLKTQEDTRFQELKTRLQAGGFLISKIHGRDCDTTFAEYTTVSCSVERHGNLATVAKKSVLCENKTGMNAPTTTCVKPTTTPAASTTTDSPTTTAEPTTTSATTAAPTATSATTTAPTATSATTTALTTTTTTAPTATSTTTTAPTTTSTTTTAPTTTSTTTTAPTATSTTTTAPTATSTTTTAPTTTTAAPATTTTTTARTTTSATTAAPTITPPCRKTTNTTLPCCCKCYKVRNFTKELNLTTETFLEKRDKEIKKELTVNVSNLSNTKAKKISQLDQRGSSQSMGSLAIVLFAVVFGMIVLSDFNKMGACPHCLRRNEKEEIRLQEEEKMETEEQKREWGAEMGNEEDGENLIKIKLRMMQLSETGSDVSPEAESEV